MMTTAHARTRSSSSTRFALAFFWVTIDARARKEREAGGLVIIVAVERKSH